MNSGSCVRSLTAAGLLALLLAAGCARRRETPQIKANSPHRYSIRGNVVSVDANNGVISLDTDAIPGVMEAMTMAYTLRNPSAAQELHPGDRIHAQLEMNAHGAELSDITITHQAVLNALPAEQYHLPKAGDLVPDFRLINQSGRAISFRRFRGKVLVLTFIYTRCASAQFCPLMSRNFADLETLLAADPKLYDRTHLLSISFDPAYDTPAVLRSYGGAYTGRYTRETFRHWEFAAPPQGELASLLQWFDVGVTRGDGSVLLHSVSTAVIGPRGRVRYWYPGNDWTPQQVFADVRNAANERGVRKGRR